MRTPITRRPWRLAASAAVAVAVAGALPAVSASTSTANYIVQASSVSAAQTAVTLAGGTLGVSLPLVSGVVATLTPAEVTALSATLNVTPDAVVQTSMAAGKPGPKPTPSQPPPPPPPPVNVFREVTHASDVSGNTGQGVGIAVVDTGIAPLPDFGTRLKAGVDLSGEGNAQSDKYGHGTFVAGLIAGSGASSGGAYVGEAPGADLVPVKVAGKDGKSNVSTVIQGLQWIKDHPTNIRVINLSLGAVPVGPTALNPLDQAVEAMTRSNFVVVTSAGNSGPQRGTITSPGDDPLVITVGALDDAHTVSTADDSVPAFSSHGPTSYDAWWKPDVLAPGKSVVSVISNRSAIWNNNPSARIGSTNFIGSGTSFAAAITSGAAAMLVNENPAASPSNVKAALLTTTNAGPAPPQDPFQQGHGVLDVARAIAEPLIDLTPDFTGILTPALGTAVPLISTQLPSGWADGLLYPLPYSGPATQPVGGAVFESTAWNSTAWNSTAWNSTAWNSTAWNSTAWNSAMWN